MALFGNIQQGTARSKMNEHDFEKIESMISRHVGAFSDSIQHKLDLVVEGHQMLSEKIDRVEARLDGRIDCVVGKLDATAAKLDAVAEDLKAHRRDTEAHSPVVYRVKE
jgi:hypothetical protein